jgi:hypothetical protein
LLASSESATSGSSSADASVASSSFSSDSTSDFYTLSSGDYYTSRSTSSTEQSTFMHQARINDSFSAGLTAFYLLLAPYSNCLVAEVAQISYGGALRTIALSSTDGVRLGLPAMISYNPVRVPVSLVTLGRLFNVVGASVDAYADVCFSSSFCAYPISTSSFFLKGDFIFSWSYRQLL